MKLEAALSLAMLAVAVFLLSLIGIAAHARQLRDSEVEVAPADFDWLLATTGWLL